MLRSLKIGSVLAATTAALALGIAAPASAAPVGAQAVIGSAFTLTNQLGAPSVLQDVGDNCTRLYVPNQLFARSALNLEDSGQNIEFYTDDECTNLVATLNASTTMNTEIDDFGDAEVRYYKTVAA